MSADATASERRRARRIARAEAQRRRALSPVRILFRLTAIPFIAAAVGLSIYIRTSDYPPPDALRHLIAMGGCSAAISVGLAPAFQGGLGYHARNDRDGDGIACNFSVARRAPIPAVPAPAAAPPATEPPERMGGGAKFVRP